MSYVLSVFRRLGIPLALAMAITLLPWRIQAASMSPSVVANGTVGTAYTQTITSPAQAPLPLVWTISSGSLPPGLSLHTVSDYAVTLDGVPTTNGGFTFVVRAAPQSVPTSYYDKTYTMSIYPEFMLGTDGGLLTSGRVGEFYSKNLGISGGLAPYTWSVTGGSLPPGVVLSGGGVLNGTATTAGTYSFTIKVNDSMENSVFKSYSIVVDPALVISAPVIQTTALSNGMVNATYSADLSLSGGVAPYRWSVISGSLPTGLALTEAGRLHGMPTMAGTYRFTLEVSDSGGRRANRDFIVTIQSAAAPIIVPPTGSAEREARLQNFVRIGVSVHNLVKLPDDGNVNTQADSAVYYLGTDGRRHAFPNAHVYFSWYSSFGGVRVISASQLASIPLGRNVTYRPGIKMVKFTTDNRVYVVAPHRTLRWVVTEEAARSLYGSSWSRMIDDIPDTFYTDYVITTDLAVRSILDFNPATVAASVSYVSETFPAGE